jgi:predicted O-methyltransferase YrrM
VELFLKTFSQFKDRAEVFSYGIDTTLFRPNKKIKNSFIYSSFPNRGLLPLLQMWPKIKAAIPDATLNVYSDIDGEWVNKVAKEQMDEIKRLIKSGLDGVKINGWVSKRELASAWSKADIWLYPCIFEETFCLTALEAAATKTLAISCPLAALKETISDRGILISGNPLEQEWQDKAISEIVNIISDLQRKNELIEKNYNWAERTTWKHRGEEFLRKYIDKSESINIAEMYNWVNDLPVNENHRQKFEEALKIANPKRILEIGTYAGTSLIAMLKLYPEAKGVAIDNWRNYDEDGIKLLKNIEENELEKIFYENVRMASMTNRIKGIKGDSVDKLCELIEAGQQFDFIYVDGSHKCLDCYGDMILAWQLLRRGGVLAVDDVMYNFNKVEKGFLLDYPLKAKEHFMKKYIGQYSVISDSYRLFIQKL